MPLVAAVPELVYVPNGPRVFLADGRSAIVSYVAPRAMLGVRLAGGGVVEVPRASVTSAIGPMPELPAPAPAEQIRSILATWRARGLDVHRVARKLAAGIREDLAHGAPPAEGEAMLAALAELVEGVAL